jgi:hypothetical protein
MWNRLPIPENSDIGNVRVILQCDVFVLVLLQENATVSSVCIVELHVCQQYENIEVLHSNAFFGEFVSPVKIKRSTYLHVKWPTSLSGFNRISNVKTDFRKRPQYEISQKSVQWEPRWYVWTDGQTMTQLSEHTDWLYPCSRVRGKLIALS